VVCPQVRNGFVFVHPSRDAHGRRVIVNVATRMDPSRHTNADVMRALLATFETLMECEENQIRGVTVVIYAKGLGYSHLGIWTPADAARLFGTCEKNLPVRHKDINLVHLPFAMWAVVEFVKQFLTTKIKERISSISCGQK